MENSNPIHVKICKIQTLDKHVVKPKYEDTSVNKLQNVFLKLSENYLLITWRCSGV